MIVLNSALYMAAITKKYVKEVLKKFLNLWIIPDRLKSIQPQRLELH